MGNPVDACASDILKCPWRNNEKTKVKQDWAPTQQELMRPGADDGE